MPRPSPIPVRFEIGATVRPAPLATMVNMRGQRVSVKMFCIERSIEDFKVSAHDDVGVTLSTPQHDFRITWEEGAHWNFSRASPIQLSHPSWLTVGRLIRYVGSGPLNLTSIGTVTLTGGPMTGKFRVLEVQAEQAILEGDGTIGRFQLPLDPPLGPNWTVVVDNHNDRIKHADFLTPGRRITPLDVLGNPVGETSYVIVSVQKNGNRGGVMDIAPLSRDGVSGPSMMVPCWNSAEMWGLAWDDVSKVKLEPGMQVHRDGVLMTVVRVNELTKQVTYTFSSEHMAILGDPSYQPILPAAPETGVDRYQRFDSEDHADP